MIIKSTLLALATIAALGTTMLTATTSSADAAGFRGHGGGMRGGGFSAGRHVGGGFRHGGGLHRHGHFGHRHGHWHGHRHAHWHGRHWHHRHIYYARPVVYGVRPVVYGAAPAVVSTNRCTCLTKEYTPEGAVLFKDICTNEAAINPPPGPAPVQQQSYAPQAAPQYR